MPDDDYEAIWAQAQRRLGLQDLTDAEKAALIPALDIAVTLLDNE